MTDSTVSVIVTCYNYGSYLASAVESALEQSYRDVEVIIVDDGSTDDTPLVAARLAVDPRVVYVRQLNQGQASAKNTGIARASGGFIAFLDADDLWRADKLEKQIPLFGNPAVGVVYSRMRPIGTDGKLLPVDEDEAPTGLAPRRGRVSEALFIDNFIPFSSSVVRRAVFARVGVMDVQLSMGIDWDLWLRASVDFEFDFVEENLLFYRVGHPGQMSKNLEERHVCAERIMDKFADQNPSALRNSVIRRARAYTLNNRGLYYQRSDLRRSTQCYLKSLALRPLQWYAYRGLMVNALRASGLAGASGGRS